MRMNYTDPEMEIRVFESEQVGTAGSNGTNPIYVSSAAYNDAQKDVAAVLGEAAAKASYIFTYDSQ